MANLFDSLFRAAAGFAETGLLMANAAMQTAQKTIDSMAGLPPAPPVVRPPLEGPTDIDSAVSELTNRAVRIGRLMPLREDGFAGASKELLDAIRYCFHFVDLKDPRSLTLPLQIPLSFGTLMAQSGLRGLATFQVVGPKKFPEFVANVVEMFSEVHIYVSVQYREIIDRHEAHLKAHPGDAGARMELGRIFIKCGRYADAARELLEASKDPAVRAGSLHEAAVALYRGGRFKEAVDAASDSLTLNPANERTRAWLWQCVQKAGGVYPASVPASNRMEMKTGYDTPSVTFTDIAAKCGLDKTSAGRGLAVFDYNNDGYQDVVIAAAHAGCSLYRNNGDGTFTDASVGSGLDDCVNGFAIAVGDYDNDGYPDLFVTRLGFFVGQGELYHNNGDGTFTDVTAKAGVNAWGPAFTAGWVDYDGDGNLDLFIANNLGALFDRKTPNRLFHNNGDGTFTEVAEKAGLHTIWPTIGHCWGDYDNDGRPDLFLSNAMGRSQLYHNNGDGTFTDVSATAGFDDHCIGSTAFWIDYDNDGWLDLVQFTWSDHEDVVHTMRTGRGPEDGHPLRLYHNNRNGTFTLVSEKMGIDGCWGTMSGNAGDFNNDGVMDLVLGNGSPRMDRVEPLVLLENTGGKFHNVTFSAGLPFTGKGHGGNLADLFGDGRLSVLVATGGAYPGELLTSGVYYPTKLPGNYLNVRLKGTTSNRDAIGARVCLEAGGAKQYREVNGGTNFGCLPFEQHFGLAKIDKVDALEIRWPSGLRQRWENPPINDTIRVTEGQDGWETVYPKRVEQANAAD
jgi:tetratricopeptide (TPR) repeat protein